MKKIYFLLALFLATTLSAQVATPSKGNFYGNEKEFSKDIALVKAKYFLFNDVFGKSDKVSPFEVIPLAASNSGELTTLLYKSDEYSKEGIVLGFYGDFVNEAGVRYQRYAHKNLNKEEAIAFLDKISSALTEYNKFLKKDTDSNNIYFSFKDIDVLISYSGLTQVIRLYWNGFDSTWNSTAYYKAIRRFEK